MPLPPGALGELVLARREDQLQHSTDSRGAPLPLFIGPETEVALRAGGLDQHVAGPAVELERANHLEAAVDEPLRRQRAAAELGARAQLADDLPQTGFLRIGDL